ncbi:MAG TPA: hypothetical protein VIJ79_00315 [Acidobacteriaceae bacterium]
MDAEDNAPTLIPDQYTKSRFWRFILDTNADAERPDEPRFKQFSDNLRNYAVAAVMFKGAQAIPLTIHHPTMMIGRIVLTILAILATAFSALQQFGLLVISSHWFLGWDVWDHMAISRGREFSKSLKIIGKPQWMRRPRTKMYGSMLVTFFVLWAMLAFVLSPIL